MTAPPFKQIAIAAAYDDNCNDVVYALDEQGRVWRMFDSDALNGRTWRLMPNEVHPETAKGGRGMTCANCPSVQTCRHTLWLSGFPEHCAGCDVTRAELARGYMEPIVLHKGRPFFKGNAIVERLFHGGVPIRQGGGLDLNAISMWDVPVEDKEQFWQLLGYSISGYGELSFIRPETIERADEIAAVLLKEAEG